MRKATAAELASAAGVGVVTGGLSGVWAGPVGGAPVAVDGPAGAWGLWPVRPKGGRTGGFVVPVVGAGVEWLRGDPEALSGDSLRRTVVAAAGGDPTALQDLARRAGGDPEAAESGAEGWAPVGWPRAPVGVRWLDLLGGRAAAVVEGITRNTGAPEGLVGLIAVGLAASTLAARVEVVMLDPAGTGAEVWREHPALFALAIAPSGALKSPIFNPLLEPLRVRGAEVAAVSRARRDEHRGRVAVANALLKQGKADPAELAEAARIVGSPVPTVRKLMIANATPAALVELLVRQPSVLLVSQEATSFFSTAVREGAVEIEGLLHAYAGEAYPGVARIGRETDVVPGVRLRGAVVGATQPRAFYGIAQTPQFADQGLLARFLYAVWSVDERTGGGAGLSDGAVRAWGSLLADLWAIPEVERLPDGTDVGAPAAVTIGPEGTRALLAFRDRLQARAGLGGDLRRLEAWVNKAHGQAARLAAALTLLEDPGARAVPAARVTAAIELVEGPLLDHAAAALGLAEWPEGTDDAQDLWERARGVPAPWTLRDLEGTLGPYGGWSPARLRRALGILVERGFARWVPGARHAAGVWLPNPRAAG